MQKKEGAIYVDDEVMVCLLVFFFSFCVLFCVCVCVCRWLVGWLVGCPRLLFLRGVLVVRHPPVLWLSHAGRKAVYYCRTIIATRPRFRARILRLPQKNRSFSSHAYDSIDCCCCLCACLGPVVHRCSNIFVVTRNALLGGEIPPFLTLTPPPPSGWRYWGDWRPTRVEFLFFSAPTL